MSTRSVIAIAAAVGIAAAAVAVVLTRESSPVTGSGNIVSATRQVPAFDRIELSGAAAVHVTVGRPTAVVVRADDNVAPLVETKVVDGKLVVSERPGLRNAHELTVDVSTPRLVASELSGAGTLAATGISAQRFAALLSGTGKLDLDGAARTLDARVTGTGAAQLEHLRAQAARVDLRGTGMAHVFATGSLDASLSGTGAILYSGNPPVVRRHVSGTGAVISS